MDCWRGGRHSGDLLCIQGWIVNQNQKRAGGLAIAAASLLAFVTAWEGSEPTAYADRLAGGLPTVCNGHTGPKVKVGDVWTKEQCDAILVKDIKGHGQRLLSCITVPINQNEYNAYTSWAYNVGTNAACKSTAIRLLNSGDHVGACNQLLRWDRANGVRIKGLANRRKAERDLCLKPVSNSTLLS